MKNKHVLLLLLLSFIGISSCTMEKRHYQSGYYIDWKKNAKNTAAERVAPIDLEKIISKPIEQSNYLAANDDNFILAETKNTEAPKVITNKNNFEVKQSKKATSKVTLKEKIKIYKAVSNLKKTSKRSDADDIPTALLYIIAFFIPPLAVGLITDWEIEQTLISLGLTLLCWLPGVVYAIIKVSHERT